MFKGFFIITGNSDLELTPKILNLQIEIMLVWICTQKTV